MRITVPFEYPPPVCLSIGPSQGLAYTLDKDIVLKLPFQYEVSKDTGLSHCWDLSMGSFVDMEKEVAVYEALPVKPHPNFARMLATNKRRRIWLEVESMELGDNFEQRSLDCLSYHQLPIARP